MNRTEKLLEAALLWIWEHSEKCSENEYKRILKKHLGMNDEEIKKYSN